MTRLARILHEGSGLGAKCGRASGSSVMLAGPCPNAAMYSFHKVFCRIVLAAVLIAAGGCGKPPPQQQGGGDYPVRAVIAPVEQRPIEEKIFLVGNLAPNEFVDIRSEIDGQVTNIGFEEGDFVEAGQVLVRLDDSKLLAQVEQARAQYELAKQDLDRGRTLLARRTISEQQFDQFRTTFEAASASLRLAQERLGDSVLRAPFSGHMTERRVSLGQYVDTGELISSLVQINPLKVEFNVPERYLAQVAVDQTIAITSEAYPDERFTGQVYFVSPQLDERNRTVLVKAMVDNSQRRLKPGMFAKLELIFRAREDALVIPESAISFHGDETTVVVMNEEGRAEFRTVRVGLRLAGMAEILDGLHAGELLVVEGFQKMGPGTRIQISPRSRRYGVSIPAGEEHAG